VFGRALTGCPQPSGRKRRKQAIPTARPPNVVAAGATSGRALPGAAAFAAAAANPQRASLPLGAAFADADRRAVDKTVRGTDDHPVIGAQPARDLKFAAKV